MPYPLRKSTRDASRSRSHVLDSRETLPTVPEYRLSPSQNFQNFVVLPLNMEPRYRDPIFRDAQFVRRNLRRDVPAHLASENRSTLEMGREMLPNSPNGLFRASSPATAWRRKRESMRRDFVLLGCPFSEAA